MSKFQKMLATADKEIKMPKTESPKEETLKKDIRTTSVDERSVIDLGVIAKKLRGESGLTDTDKYDLESYARTKAPTISDDIVGYIVEEDILSPNLIKDIFARTNVGAVLGIEEVEDIADAITLDKDEAVMKIVGEGANIPETNNTYDKFKHFVTDIGGHASWTKLASDRSIINIAQNKLGTLQNSMGRAFESMILNGDNSGTHFDTGAGYLADSPEKAFKGVRKLGNEKQTKDFGGATLSDADLIKNIQDMGLLGGVYLDPNAVAQMDVALVVDQALYNRMTRMDVFIDASKTGNGSTLAGGRNVPTFMGIPLVMSSYMPQKTDATGVVGGAANDFSSCILANINMLKPYFYGSANVDTKYEPSNKTNYIYLTQHFGFGGLWDSRTESYVVDTTRKYVVQGININPN